MSYARTAVTRMTLDMSRPDLQRSETVTLGDTNRRWEITLINGGAPFRLPPNWTAALTGIKPDGNGLLNGCSVVDGKIIYDFAAGKEIATCVGSYPVQFDIWDEVGGLVASPKVYVNVLADARPHAELKSEGQYTLIGDAIKKITDMEKDVELLADTALAQGDDIAALEAKITTAGTVTIPVSEWDDMMPTKAYVSIQGGDALTRGGLLLVMPGDTATKDECERARVRIDIDLITDQQPPSVNQIVFIRAEERPAIPLNFKYFVLKTESQQGAVVALIGVDSYGEGGGAASGVDESAVKAIIAAMLGNVANERQYSADNPPPYPVTSVNNQTGAVTLFIPSEAADVKADPVGTAETKTAALRDEVNKSLDARLKSADLQTKLDEYRAAKGLIDKTVSDLLYYYNKSQTLTKEEINALVSAIPKFKIEVVTSLPTSNISDTTVYLVKSGDDDTNLYTEYIRTGGKWEKLGTQTVDLTGYATEAWVNDILAAYVKTVDMVAYVTGLLAGYLNKEDAAKTYQLVGDYPTTADMGTAISNATKDLAPKSLIPTKVSQLTNDSGYLTKHQSLDHLLPKNQGAANAGKLMMVADDGSVTYIEIADLGLSGGDVIGNIDSDKNIVLTGDLAPGTYTFAYLVRKSDGTTETVTIGTYTVEDESETKTYTITWVVDGKTTTETYEEGETPTFKGSTDKAADDEYTYTFAGWSPEIKAVKADATYTATYTQTAKPVVTNFANPNSADWKTGYRLSTDAFGSKQVAGAAITNFVDVKYGDTVTVTGINFTDSENRQTFSDGRKPIGISKAADWAALALHDTIDDITYDSNTFTFKVVYAQSGKIIQARFSGLLTGAATDVVINIKRNGAWLTA